MPSVIGTLGGPTSIEETLHYRRDDLQSYNRDSGFTEFDPRITYKWNNYGFRSPMITDPLLPPSMLTLGCSFTVCLGVPYSDSWPCQLQHMFPDLQLHNLGVCGCSTDFVVRLLYKTISLLNVKRVFVLWPPLVAREIHYDDIIIPFKIHSGSPNSRIATPAANVLCNKSYVLAQYQKNIIMAEAICKINNVKINFLSTVPVSNYINTPDNNLSNGYTGHLLGREHNFKYARDNFHFGVDWCTFVADQFYNLSLS